MNKFQKRGAHATRPIGGVFRAIDWENTSVTITNCSTFSIAVLSSILGILFAGCSAPDNTKSYEDYPEFREGGTMTLNVEGQSYSVALEDITFVNTDAGYGDYVEITGPNTHIVAECANKDLNFDSDTAYAPLVNQPLPIGVKGLDEDMSLDLPGLGTYPVTGGKVTVQKFQTGRDGRDWWDGQISVDVTTNIGPRTVSGSFSWCIVSVW